MPEVFISYRQTTDAERERVRAFATRLQDSGIKVILDQFYLDDHPASPPEKWPKWSSDQAIRAERVIIIGSESWFQCFDGTQEPGTGLGAACEADDIRTRIYDSGNVNEDIRVVVFDDRDAIHISKKLKGYHRFHAERDFGNIVKWLGGTQPIPNPPPKTSTPNNLPRLEPFFGRERELMQIADALDPESRTWGALIDGPGGMGKTSLAVRAAYDCPPGQFDRIVFVSVKDREMDDDGVRKLGSFILPGLLEMLNELARELGHSNITKSAEDERIRLLHGVLRDTKTLIILDNLESLSKDDRDQLFTFVKRLPEGCKAILTSRRRIGSSADTLILEKLDLAAAMETIEDIARHNPLLKKASETARIALYEQTGGKPLLLRWTVGQIGRGSCRTVESALSYLRSCPKDNDPLEFIFGDLVNEFSQEETKILAALSYFTLPVKTKHIADVAGVDELLASDALFTLCNRSIVVPDQEEHLFALVPLVPEFLRRKRPEAVAETGNRLENSTYAMISDNGDHQYERNRFLEAYWPVVSAALPLFISGPNEQLQNVCASLKYFLDSTGHYDELLALAQQAEANAVAHRDFLNAGWRAHEAGWVHYHRIQADEVLSCSLRASSHWKNANAGAKELATAIRLRGIGHDMKADHSSALAAYEEALELLRTIPDEHRELAKTLSNVAHIKIDTGDLAGAGHDLLEALALAQLDQDSLSIAAVLCNLADLAISQANWQKAETFARQALDLPNVQHRELDAHNCLFLATALLHQGNKSDALPYISKSVNMFRELGHRELDRAITVLCACEV